VSWELGEWRTVLHLVEPDNTTIFFKDTIYLGKDCKVKYAGEE